MRFTTLSEWLTWQENLHPLRIELRLERLRSVWQRLGPPALPGPVVTVGGTNGKGSTLAYLEACCRAGGLRTGLYTSPHLLRYNERVRLDGQEASDQALCEAFDRVDQARGEIPLTYFEFGTLAALVLFCDTQVEVLLLEVGLGGRLDAVNLLDADIAVVTSIGHDHMAWLGEDLNQIAAEKAGIFRAGRPAILGHRQPPPRLREQAETLGAEVFQLGREFDWRQAQTQDDLWNWRHVDGTEFLQLPPPALHGCIQYDNAATALCALQAANQRGLLNVPGFAGAISHGLISARLPGRLQILPGEPRWIFDVAHNREAALVLAEHLRGLERQGPLHLVLAMLADKEAEIFAAVLAPLVDHWYLAEPPGERAMPLTTLAAAVGAAGVAAPELCAGLEPALALAQQRAGRFATILVTGSFMTVEAGLRMCRPWKSSRAPGS
jgi:dihydrofolate synthase/folylpolyglutamate synthase